MKTNAKIILFVLGAVLLSGAGIAGGVALNRLNKGIATPETSSKSSGNSGGDSSKTSSNGSNVGEGDTIIIPGSYTIYF